VQMVNMIHTFPYLPLIEAFLLGVPIITHLILGVQYLRTAKLNSFPSDGSTPSLGEYANNHAFTFQRITSWILLVGVLFHVFQMRFLEYPTITSFGEEKSYMIKLDFDEGLYTVAQRLDVDLYSKAAIKEKEKRIATFAREVNFSLAGKNIDKIKSFRSAKSRRFDPEKAKIHTRLQEVERAQSWLAALQKRPINDKEVIAVANNFGTAALLIIRDTFKSPLMIGLYTVFVLSASFHAFNGLWTFCITWGLTVTPRSQKIMRVATTAIMALVAFFGLASIWGTYWLNLRV